MRVIEHGVLPDSGRPVTALPEVEERLPLHYQKKFPSCLNRNAISKKISIQFDRIVGEEFRVRIVFANAA
jgi:hypothetical protein